MAVTSVTCYWGGAGSFQRGFREQRVFRENSERIERIQGEKKKGSSLKLPELSLKLPELSLKLPDLSLNLSVHVRLSKALY